MGGAVSGGKRGRGAPNKALVAGAVEQRAHAAGSLRLAVVPHASKDKLGPFVRGAIDASETTVLTDGLPAYAHLGPAGVDHRPEVQGDPVPRGREEGGLGSCRPSLLPSCPPLRNQVKTAQDMRNPETEETRAGMVPGIALPARMKTAQDMRNPETEEARGDGPRYRFAGYELDIDALELRRGGQPMKLEPKPLAVLMELVRNPTRVVTREELRERIWQNTHVADGSLPRAVAALRTALGRTSARTDGIVKTVRGRGYRIGVPVTQALPDLASRAPIGERESGPLLGMERGRGSTDPQRARRARVCGELALLSLRANEPDRADVALEEMLAHTRRVEDPVLALELCTEHLQIAGLGLPLVDPSRHLTRIDHVIAEAERLGNPRAEVEARRQRMDRLLQAGERAALEAECERFARASVRSGGLMRLRAAAYPVMLATLSGNWEQARRGIAEYEELADPNDRPETPFTPVTQRVLITQNDTELAAAEREVRQVLADFPEWPTWRCALTYVLMRREHRREARAEFEAVVRDGLDPAPPQLNHPVFLAVVAEAASWLGATQHAAEIYERLRPFAGRNVSHGWAVGCHGPVDHFLALLARLLGRPAEARRHHEEALAMAERLASPPWKARAQLALAQTLAAQPRFAERARAHAGEARDLATALGMRRLAEEAEVLLVAEASREAPGHRHRAGSPEARAIRLPPAPRPGNAP